MPTGFRMSQKLPGQIYKNPYGHSSQQFVKHYTAIDPFYYKYSTAKGAISMFDLCSFLFLVSPLTPAFLFLDLEVYSLGCFLGLQTWAFNLVV